MTPEEIKAYLNGHSEATKSMIEIFVSNNSRKFERLESLVNDLRHENCTLREQLKVCEIQVEENIASIQELQKEKDEQSKTIKELESKIMKVDQRCDEQEDRSRRSNLRFDNIPETPNETWENTSNIVTGLLKKLELPEDVPLDRVHRVGSFNPNQKWPRTVVAKFSKFRDRETVYRMRNSSAWKSTGVKIKEDLCEASRKKITDQWPELKKAWEEGKRAFFNHTTLVVKPAKTPQQQRRAQGEDQHADPASGAGEGAEGAGAAGAGAGGAGAVGAAEASDDAGDTPRRDSLSTGVETRSSSRPRGEDNTGRGNAKGASGRGRK